MIEELFGPAHIHIVTDAIASVEMSHKAHMNDGIGPLGPEHVLEFPFSEIDAMGPNVKTRPPPGTGIDPANIHGQSKSFGKQSTERPDHPWDQHPSYLCYGLTQDVPQEPFNDRRA